MSEQATLTRLPGALRTAAITLLAGVVLGMGSSGVRGWRAHSAARAADRKDVPAVPILAQRGRRRPRWHNLAMTPTACRS